MSAPSELSIPSEFKKIIVDMTRDILNSFPEQEANLQKDLKNLLFETGSKACCDHYCTLTLT